MIKTDFERLNHIKKCIDISTTLLTKKDALWLVEKVEQLQKQLEAKIILINNGWEEERYVLQEENIRLREALEFYTDKDLYQFNRFINDVGKTAREALGSE